MRNLLPVSVLRPQRRDSAAPSPAGAMAGAMSRMAAMWSVAAVDNPYSRRVALLKRALPAIGVLLLLLIAAWPQLAPVWERMRFAFPAIDLRDARELRMLNPRYAGTDRLGRPYVVTAAVGHQVPDRQDLMSLEGARAEVKSHGGADVVVTAETGVYQSQAQLLDLFGNVTLVHENGTKFVTQRARLDVAHNAAEGSDPVEGHGPSGDINAQGFRIYDKGDTVIFTGNSETLLRAAKMTAANPRQPPAVPAAVAATASRVEAQERAAAHRGATPAAVPHKATPAAKPDAKPARHSAPAAADATSGKRG
jgi:lipopolysaccharide export system protein LptC